MESIPTRPEPAEVASPNLPGRNTCVPPVNWPPGIKLNIFELLVLFVTVTSFVSIILLTIGRFHSLTALAASLVILAAGILIFKINITVKDTRFHPGLWLVLLIALVFRCQPYLYLSGGQDEGIYISMSAQYERHGGITFPDKIRQQFNDDQVKVYDQAGNSYPEGILAFKGPSYLHPFYPLHPLWLAIFGKLFGGDNRSYSLLFFSLLSITAFYLLAFEISGRKLPAFLTGLFLAVNPLMVFVSKMPFSETTSLAFTSLGFYYLARFMKANDGARQGAVCLVLSCLLFNCFFYTRMSAVIYMPYFCFLALAGVFYLEDRTKLKSLLTFFLAVFLLYALATFFYAMYLPPLYSTWLKAHIIRPLGPRWQVKLITGLIAFIALLFIAGKLAGHENLKRRLTKTFDYLLPFTAFILLGAAAYELYKLGFTASWINTVFGYGGNGLRDIRVTSIYNFFLYLSPIGFVVFFIAVCQANKIQNNPAKLLFIFVLLFLFFMVIYVKIPYQYYYARYLSTEVVPFGLLLVALFCGATIRHAKRVSTRIACYIAVAAMAGYFIIFSCFQFQGVEGAKADALKRLRERVRDNDLLFYHECYYFTYAVIGTPIKYYYDLNTIRLTQLKDYSEIFYLIKSIGHKYRNIYLMTPDKKTDRNLFTEIDTVTYQHGFYFNGYHQHYQDNQIEPFYQSFELPFYRFLIPAKYCIWKRQYYLYQINVARAGESSMPGSPPPPP